jgi:dihydroorotase
VVSPGFFDLHCHLRQPGFEDKETIATGTAAAARGGFTTVCSMANTSPPIDTRALVEYVRAIAAAEGSVRVLPIAAITKGLAGVELTEMADLIDAGAVAFSDDGRAVANSRLMRHALEYSAMFGQPIIQHSEDRDLAKNGSMNEGLVATRLGLRGIPAAAEEVIVARDIAIVARTGGRLHVAHVSTAAALEHVRRAKSMGLPVTAEVTPHHLTMTDDWVAGYRPDGGRGLPYDANTKVNPPLRTAADVEALVAGLRDGTIEAVATDHAPHTVVDKLCEYDAAAFGISGLETALGLLLGLVHAGKIDLPTLLTRLTLGPAQVLGLTPAGLQTGAVADITVFDPAESWIVDPAAFASKGRNTPLAGVRLLGRTVATIAGGRLAYSATNRQAGAISSTEVK